MIADVDSESTVRLGGGAQFWVYVSPDNKTDEYVTDWEVKIEQIDGNWTGSITSENPYQQLKTSDLSGVFKVTITASGPKFSEATLTPVLESSSDVSCSSKCAAMIGIVATDNGDGANYWTVGDAMCAMESS